MEGNFLRCLDLWQDLSQQMAVHFRLKCMWDTWFPLVLPHPPHLFSIFLGILITPIALYCSDLHSKRQIIICFSFQQTKQNGKTLYAEFCMVFLETQLFALKKTNWRTMSAVKMVLAKECFSGVQRGAKLNQHNLDARTVASLVWLVLLLSLHLLCW